MSDAYLQKRMRLVLLHMVCPLFWALLVAAVPAICGQQGENAIAKDCAESPRSGRALLVGCGNYSRLDKARWLRGPATDVVLMRDLLVSRFCFDTKQIRTLTDSSAVDRDQPTRANIEHEFHALAKVARPDDQVVIFLAGHGSQQPDEDPSDPNDPEPDGLDEIFLPIDVEGWDDTAKVVKNAIVDDEIRMWVKAIADRGATVCIIVDACHSGTVTRGADVLRSLPREKLVPAEALRAAQRISDSRKITDFDGSSLKITDIQSDTVAICAAQSNEPTVESELPKDASDAKPCGLLTFTLCKILKSAPRPMTYAELMQRVTGEYAAMGRNFPTPLLEGAARNRQVLGQQEWDRSRILLSKNKDGLNVNAGSLSGLSSGTILAVYPPAGAAGDDHIVGYVRITKVRFNDSFVESFDYAGSLAAHSLDSGRCEPVEISYTQSGIGKLPVAVDIDEPDVNRAVMLILEDLCKRLTAVYHFEANRSKASWVILHENGQVLLAPTSGFAEADTGKPESAKPRQLYRVGFANSTDQLRKSLDENLQRISRAQHLLALCAAVSVHQEHSPTGPQVDMQLLRLKSNEDLDGTVVQPGRDGLKLQVSDQIAFRLSNRGLGTVDVTLLFVDGDYGIQQVFPASGTTDGRLARGDTRTTPSFTVERDTLGLEHLVLVAVPAAMAPVDFGWLSQSSLDRTRGDEHPLGKLMSTAMYGQGQTRSLKKKQVDAYQMQVLSWRTVEKK